MTIAYFVHGRGRGHSTRALSVAKKLRAQGHELHLYAGRDAYPILKPYSAQYVESIFPKRSPLHFFKRTFEDFKKLKKLKPRFVISDGDAPSILVAWILNIESIAIGHALVFPYCIHPISLDRKGLQKESLKVKIASTLATHKLIVHFCKVKTKISQAQVVRPELTIGQNYLNDDYLISYFRDGNGAEVVQMLAKKGLNIKNFGNPIDCPGVENFDIDNDTFKRVFSKAKGVVSSAGSNVIFESMVNNKPLLALYKTKDFEQSANAKYLSHLNCGIGMAFEHLAIKDIEHFINKLNMNISNQDHLNELTELTDAVENIVNVKK